MKHRLTRNRLASIFAFGVAIVATRNRYHYGGDMTDQEGDDWRRELLAGPLTVTQLREIVSDLEHVLKGTRRDYEALRRTNIDLVKRLAEAVAREIECRATLVRLEREAGRR